MHYAQPGREWFNRLAMANLRKERKEHGDNGFRQSPCRAHGLQIELSPQLSYYITSPSPASFSGFVL